MQKEDMAQLEMFNLDADGRAEDRGASARDPSRLKITREYKKLILKGIALILISLLAYSRGVEKGKRLAVSFAEGLTQNAAVKEAAARTVSVNSNSAATAATVVDKNAVIPKTPEAVIAPKPETGKQNYTIQVASISKDKNAKNELARLRNKGYTAFSLVKGKYTVICVGKFEEKVEAINNLEKLKVKYPDCQIRRL